MAYQSAKIIDARNNVVIVAHPDVPQFPRTTLTTAIAAGATSLVAADNQGFSLNDFILAGNIGGSLTELLSVTGAVTYGTALTTSAAVFAHPVDCPLVRFIWNQIEISGAATITGSKTVIATVSIQTDVPQTEYINTGTTYAYYFARFKNSISSVFSAYSDAAPAAGYDPTTLRAVKKTALSLTGEQVDDQILTNDFLDTEITNCEIDIWKEKRRWAHFLVDNFVLGTLTAGSTDFSLPSDIADADTDESIRSVFIRQIGMLEKADIETIEGLLWDTAHSTLSVSSGIGDTSITLSSAADFTDTGSLLVGSESVTYTARNTTTNVLSGIPASGAGSLTATHASGTDVWQGGNVELTPQAYFIKPGKLSLILPPSLTYVGQAIYLSYYSKPTYPTSDAATINWTDPSLYHFWLAWKIDLRRHNGTPTPAGEGFKNQYDARKKLLLSRARLQDAPKLMPRRRRARQEMSHLADEEIVSWTIR